MPLVNGVLRTHVQVLQEVTKKAYFQGYFMKKLIILSALLTSLSVFADPVTVNVERVDAIRLGKIIKGFSNPELKGMSKTITAETADAKLRITCTSDLTGGMESNAVCEVVLEDDSAADSEIKVTDSKKFKNLIRVDVLEGALQKQLASRLSIVPYASVRTEVLVPKEASSRSGPHPVLKISCNPGQNVCEILLAY